MAIAPCHWCGSIVRSDEYFLHNVCCASESCQTRKREADERMQAALDRVSRNLEEESCSSI